MEAKQPELSAREQAYFQHRRAAKEQGVSLKDYCRQLGINVRSLYSVRRDMVEKGVVPRTRQTKAAGKTPKGRSQKFVAVRVAAPARQEAVSVCRVRHANGWTIECREWPPAGWVTALMNGADHAAS